MASIAYRKQLDYKNAKGCILEALQLDPQSPEAVEEKTLIEELQAKTVAKETR